MLLHKIYHHICISLAMKYISSNYIYNCVSYDCVNYSHHCIVSPRHHCELHTLLWITLANVKHTRQCELHTTIWITHANVNYTRQFESHSQCESHTPMWITNTILHQTNILLFMQILKILLNLKISN